MTACANLANLFLARAEGRRQQLAIRVALGASPGRLASELLLESLILAVLGGLLGLGVAYGGIRVLIAMPRPGCLALMKLASMEGSYFLRSQYRLCRVCFSVLCPPSIHRGSRNRTTRQRMFHYRESRTASLATPARSGAGRVGALLLVSSGLMIVRVR